MVTATKLTTCAIFVVLSGLIAAAQQGKPDFSGKWVLDVARSGPEPVIWLQRRPVKFTIRQTDDDVTIDTGDGSLFGVPEPVSETPLHYRLGRFGCDGRRSQFRRHSEFYTEDQHRGIVG